MTSIEKLDALLTQVLNVPVELSAKLCKELTSIPEESQKLLLYAFDHKGKHTKSKGKIPQAGSVIPYRKKNGHDYPEGFPRVSGFKGGLIVTDTGSLYAVQTEQRGTGTAYTPVVNIFSLLSKFLAPYK